MGSPAKIQPPPYLCLIWFNKPQTLNYSSTPKPVSAYDKLVQSNVRVRSRRHPGNAANAQLHSFELAAALSGICGLPLA